MIFNLNWNINKLILFKSNILLTIIMFKFNFDVN